MSSTYSTCGWPDPDRPGVPQNPERGGFHWLEDEEGKPVLFRWLAPPCGGLVDGEPGRLPGFPWLYRYLGPCLTPAEVTAREVAAAERMREAAAAEVDCGCDDARKELLSLPLSRDTMRNACWDPRCGALAARDIRTLPIPGAASKGKTE